MIISNNYPWLFLSELLLITGLWIIMVELSNEFNSEEYFEELLRAKFLREQNTPKPPTKKNK